MHDFKSKTIQYPLTYQHFKMESINQVIDIVRPNVYKGSTNLKDAFYSIYPSTSITSKIFKICFYIKNISVHMHG